MRRRSQLPRRSRRSPVGKSPSARNRVLRGEPLETRMLLSGNSLREMLAGYVPPAACGMVLGATSINAAPTVYQAICVNGNAAVASKTAPLSVLGKDDGGETNLRYTWSVMAAPTGGNASFNINGTNLAKNAIATFTEAGTYTLSVKIVDAGNLSVTASKSVVVTSTVASIYVATTSGQIVNPGSTLFVSGTSQVLIALGMDQFGNVMATQPTYGWSTTVPGGSLQPTIVTSGPRATFTFRSAGTYGVTVQAKSASGATISDRVSLASVSQISAVRNAPTNTVMVTGTSLQPFIPSFIDQFGNVVATPALSWYTYTAPQGAPAPVITTGSSGLTTITFGMAGSYTFDAYVVNYPSVMFATKVTVAQTLTKIALSPSTCSVAEGATQQFTAQTSDQFGKAMATQPAFAWSAVGGSVSTSGMFTAPNNTGSCSVTAKSGSLSGMATVSVVAKGSTPQNVTLMQLVQSLDADGSISRNDMIQIFRTVAAEGIVSATDLSELKSVLNEATALNMPGYVQALASDVINSNPANATYQGKTLGNLYAGSSGAQLTNLVNKWFLGTDLPTLTSSSLVYTSVAGTLFPHTPSHTDEYQGELGDCYYISSLGTLADSNPAAVENMFINNGDGTYTVRFYTGTYGSIYNYSNGSYSDGFLNSNITADYVTVNAMLPTTTSGMLVYADYGASAYNSANTLWIPMAEKAYAEWDQTGKEGRSGVNSYNDIQGGWMATVYAQVLGHNATDYAMSTTSQQVAVNALAAHDAVTVGTNNFSGTEYGLYADHAYAIVGYNAYNSTFILYNPWGMDQPGQLTWGELRATTGAFTVATTSGTVPISGALGQAVSVKTSLSEQLSGFIANISASEAAATLLLQSNLAPPAAADNQPSAAPSASRDLPDSLWSSSEMHSHRTHLASPAHDSLSAPSVDAFFAAAGSLPQNEVASTLA